MTSFTRKTHTDAILSRDSRNNANREIARFENWPLLDMDFDEGRDVARSGWELTWCPTCGRWYWPGTHVTRMNAWFERVLGHPIQRGAPDR